MAQTRALTRIAALGTSALIAIAIGGCATNASDDSVVTPPAQPAQSASKAGGEASAAPSAEESRESEPEEYSAPQPTKSKEVSSAEPLFVASLPDTVKANPGQKIIVQLPTDPDTRWKANVNGTASVSSVSYEGPPAGQPGAPGTSIANVTAPPAGISYINFIRVPKGGGETLETARLEVVVS